VSWHPSREQNVILGSYVILGGNIRSIHFFVTAFITVPVLDKIQLDELTGNDKTGSNSSGGSQVTTT